MSELAMVEAVKSVAEWFPRTERALGVGILNAGANFGVILTPVVGITVAGLYGWRAAFLVTATGWTPQLTGSYVPILAYAGLACLIAFIAIQLPVPRMEPAPILANPGSGA